MEDIMAYIFTPERVGLRRGLKEGMEKGLEQGMEKGIEKGLEQGITKGRLTAEQSILIRQLEHKFGITERERALILATEDSEVLERALDKVVDATSKDQVLGTLESPK
jgi:flagellar biosynthesis/type III secretory pathway protein FliH